MFYLFACWAPEIQEAKPKEPMHSTSSEAPKAPVPDQEKLTGPLTPITPEEEEELKNFARNPPYTAWTKEANVRILGPNGGTIFTLSEIGKRLEVIRVVPQYAQIVCSGCAPPKKNQAGWVNIEQIAMEWDLPEGDPLIFMLKKRNDWLKNKDTPEVITNKNDLCMLIDNGYQILNNVHTWGIQGGKIEVTKTEESWSIQSISPPSTPAASSWRCDIKYPSKEVQQ